MALIGILLLTSSIAVAQNVGINNIGSNPDPSAMLDVVSTDKGMLVPRMTTAQRTAIANPATGLLVYDNTTNAFWFFNGTAWTALTGSAGDNLGNHTASQNLALGGHWISRDGDNEGIQISNPGHVGIETPATGYKLTIGSSSPTGMALFQQNSAGRGGSGPSRLDEVA